MSERPRRHPDEALLLRIVLLVATWVLAIAIGLWLAFAGLSTPFVVWGGVAALLVLIIMIGYRYWVWKALDHDPLGDEPQWADIEEEEVSAAAARIGPVGRAAAVQFLRLLADPGVLVVRLVETLNPKNRSTEIVSSLTMRLAVTDELVFVPLIRRRRGGTDQGLTATDHEGKDAPLLPKADVLAYAVACTRTLLATVSPEARASFVSGVEPSLLRALRSTGPVADTSFVDELARLAPPGDLRTAIVRQAILQLALYDFACIEMRPESGASHVAPLSTGTRLLRFTVRRRDILVYDAPSSRVQSLVAALRTGFGIPVSSVFVRLDDANRAQSYHAELVGPENSFLARQTIYDTEKATMPTGLVVALRRFGQRHAHLYLRANKSLKGWRYAATFYERMPSSLAPVAVSALALAVLAGIGFATQLLGNTSKLLGEPAFAATLLGVPSAISVWSGVQRNRSGASGGLMTVVGTAVTIATAIVAVVINLEVGPSTPAWAAITWVAATNAAFLTSGWIARARFVHSRLYLNVETQFGQDRG